MRKNKRLPIIILVIIIITLPLILVLVKQVQDNRSRAASPDQLETEGGVLAGNATTKQDSQASGGSYVELGVNSGFSITSGPTPSNLTDTGVTITWYLSDYGSGQIEYGTTTSYGQTSAFQTCCTFDHHIMTLSGLSSGTTYHYRVRSTNQGGTETVSPDNTFTTTGGSGGTPTPTPNSSTVFNPNNVTLSLVQLGPLFTSPVYMTYSGSNLFVVEQGGKIKIMDSNGTVNSTPFLDISSKISSGGERGLLSMAFSPSYATNGKFYVYYTDPAGSITISEFGITDATHANPASERVLVSIPHPVSNHNGGLVMFGPDGLLYFGTGDGGGSGDPSGNAQNLNSLLGKLLRVNVTSPTPQIWAYGLRNPWRYTFDGNNLIIADVGQGTREEVDAVVNNVANRNYGWNIMEGNGCYVSGCTPIGVLPVTQYLHGTGDCSITGGFVYRGPQTDMKGGYFYADYCSGKIWAFDANSAVSSGSTTGVLLTDSAYKITSFGKDQNGDIYVLDASGGTYKLVDTQ